jgi:hypothetical protein
MASARVKKSGASVSHSSVPAGAAAELVIPISTHVPSER